MAGESSVLFVSLCVYRIKEWVNQIQKDLITLTDSASGLQNLKQVGVLRLLFSNGDHF